MNANTVTFSIGRIPKGRMLSFGISCLFLFTLISLVMYYQSKIRQADGAFTIRQTDLTVVLPPPPPPQKVQQKKNSQETVPDLAVSGQGALVNFSINKARGDLTIDALKKPSLDTLTNDWNESLAIDWNAFGLGELDETPRLLTSIKVKYPRTLVQRGINSAKVELDVIIDETGKVVLKQVNRNPHPELRSAIQQLIDSARFSAPQKNGAPVRARFNWPVEFTNS